MLFLAGCAATPVPTRSDTILIIPGASGDGPWYSGLRKGLADAGEAEIRTFRWGMPPPLFMLNLQDRGVHAKAEAKLARTIRQHRADYPSTRLHIVAHSAGGGVALGALRQLDSGSVDSVLLLAPSVSPKYELSYALNAMRGEIHVFHSPHDKLFLGWRTRTFGTYDNVKTPAAGNVGFDLGRLPAESRLQVIHHPWQESWKTLGNDGTHDGALSRKFARAILAPLVAPTNPVKKAVPALQPRESSAPPGA